MKSHNVHSPALSQPWRPAAGIVLALAICLLLTAPAAVTSAARPALREDAPVSPAANQSERLTATSPITKTIYLPQIYNFPAPSSIFGVQLYNWLSVPGAGLPLARQALVAWARWEASWAAIEPVDTTPDHYSWAYSDASISAATGKGFHLIITVGWNPGWAATYANGPIDKVNVSKFAEFVAAMAERYDGDGQNDAPGSPIVDTWELYNEPDGGNALNGSQGAGYWGHYGAEYARMLCAVYPAIKAANLRAKVVFGGLGYDWFDDTVYPTLGRGVFVRSFLDNVLANGGGSCFDAMAYHYYYLFGPYWESYGGGDGLPGKTNFLRNKLSAYGVTSKPMFNTESGWPSEPIMSSEEQAAWLMKAFVFAKEARLDMYIWWTWIDIPDYPGGYGLVTTSLQPKPSYYAYRTAATRLGPASFQRVVPANELGSSSMKAYQFQAQAGSPMYVVWSAGGTVRGYLPLTQARIVDRYGNLLGLVRDGDDGLVDGRIRLTVDSNPLYAEATP